MKASTIAQTIAAIEVAIPLLSRVDMEHFRQALAAQSELNACKYRLIEELKAVQVEITSEGI